MPIDVARSLGAERIIADQHAARRWRREKDHRHLTVSEQDLATPDEHNVNQTR